MEDWPVELRGIITIAVAVVLIAYAIAACSVNESRERTKVLTACLEKIEDPLQCSTLDDKNYSSRR